MRQGSPRAPRASFVWRQVDGNRYSSPAALDDFVRPALEEADARRTACFPGLRAGPFPVSSTARAFVLRDATPACRAAEPAATRSFFVAAFFLSSASSASALRNIALAEGVRSTFTAAIWSCRDRPPTPSHGAFCGRSVGM